MKVLGINLDIVWKKPAENIQNIEQFFADQQADLYILPEMFTTGFIMDPTEIADQQNKTLQWMQDFAQRKKGAVCGSVALKENNLFFNRMYFVMPDGSYYQYDKRHLFTFSGEDKAYTPGTERIIVTYHNIRFLLQICYDLRFPVFSRNKNDYDVVIYVANWPEKRVDAWRHLLKARAIENQSYVLGINRIGKDGNKLHYQESSHFFFADGSEISQKNKPFVATEINLDALNAHRAHYHFLQDADDFTLG